MESATGQPAGYPATFELDAPVKLANWRPLVQWILAIPHIIIASVLGYAAAVVWIISFFAVLLTTRIPDGLYNFQVMILRYRARAWSYAGFLHDQYPKFEFPMSPADPADHPVRVSVGPQQQLNRWLPLVKWLLAIPHLIVLIVLFIAAIVCWIIGFFAILFTGRWPAGLRDFIVNVNRYATRVSAYFLLLRDEYPPFALN